MNQESRIFDVINNLQNTKLGIEQGKFLRESELSDLSYQIDKAKIDFKRKVKFYKEKVISIEEFENVERDLKYLIEQKKIKEGLQDLDSVSRVKQIQYINLSIERMKNNLGMLKDILSNLYLKAPVSGQLSSFNSEIGETKAIGQNLGQIDVLEGFKLRANIDERYITRTFIGQEAEFDYAGESHQLQIKKIYTQVTNGSFQVDLQFINEPPEDIKRGQTLQLRLKFSGTSEAIILRRGGFFQKTGGNWIYIVDESGKFAIKKEISIGRQNTNSYEVLEGLKPGDNVVISSYDTFGDKDKLIFK